MTKIIYLIVLIAFSIKSFTQEISFTNFTIDDGLPTSELYDVEFDNHGRAWFASDRGVSRYDGYTFTNFGREDGLPDNTIFEIIKEDDTNRLWFFTYNGKITYYENDEFITSRANIELPDYKSKAWFEQIIKLDSSSYILLTKNSGTNYKRKIEDTKKRLQKVFHYNLEKDKIKKINIDSIIDCNIGDRIIHLEEYKLVIDLDYCSIHHYDKNKISTHYNVPITSNYYAYFLSKINAKGNCDYIKIDYCPEGVSIIDNKIYICTVGGLLEYDINSLKETGHYFKDYYVTEVKKGPNNNFWITTQDEGIFKTPSLEIMTFQKIKNEMVPINLKVFNDDLFITCRNGRGLFAFDNKLDLIYKIEKNSAITYPDIHIQNNKIVTCDLSVISPKAGTYQLQESNLLSTKGSKQINRVLLPLRDGRILRVIAFSNSLSIVNHIQGHNWEKLPVSFNTNIKNISTLIESATGHIYYNNPNGTYKIENENDESIKSIPIPELNFRMTEMQNFRKEGFIYATLGFGLIYSTSEEGDLYSVDEKDGLSSNSLNCIYQQGDSVLWVGTNKGLNKIYYTISGDMIKVDSIDVLTRNKGLSSNYIVDIELWNDNIWVTTKNGINYFNKDISAKDYSLPFVFFTSISSTSKILDHTKTGQLENADNDITIKYLGVYYNKESDKDFYRYKLLNANLDTNWIHTNNKEAQFNNLNSGYYTFKVEAQNSEGIWTTNAAVFNFTIKKHFTELIWLRIVAGLLIMGILLYLYRLRSNTLIKRERQQQALKEAELKLKAAELNVLRNQMNPHFIYNALNSIQNYIFQGNPEKANYLLSKFSRLMRSALNLSRLEYIIIKEEVNFLSNYLELEKMRFDDRFTYKFIIPDELLGYKIPPLLIQPLIENSIKHGFMEGKEFEIMVRMDKKGDSLKIQVIDNGKGIVYNKINYQKNNRPTAITIIKDRIAIINNGSIVKARFEIKSKIDEKGNIMGTIAEYNLPTLR